MKKTLKLPSIMSRAATFQPKTLNEETRTIDVTWTTGHKGLRRSMFGDFYEELSLEPSDVNMDYLRSGKAKFLAAHDQRSLDSVLGIIEKADIGTATVRFSSDDISQRNLQKIKDGILTDVSVGYSIEEMTDVSQPGDEIPTYRATKWTPMEVSLVPYGFDPGAKVRNQEEQLTENEVTLITRSEDTQETLKMSDKSKDAVVETVDTEALKQEAIKAERQRASEIRKAVLDAKLDASMAEEYINRGTTVEEAKTNIALFAKYATQPVVDNTTRVSVGVDESDKKRTGIADAVLYRMDSSFKPKEANEFVGRTLLRNLEAVFKRGQFESDTAYATRAMSSSDLPYILANVAEKAALKKYTAAPTTWQAWAKSATLKNFKTADKVRSGDFAALEERQENGEFKEGSFGEEREQVTLKEYGKKMSFTRRMLINDDLDEVSKVMSQGGTAAAVLENSLVYAQLTSNPTMGDGVALFHADHDNLGTGGAISDTTLDEITQLMREQTSVDGEYKLNLAPKFLITGSANENTAKKYLQSIQATQASNVNPFSNSMQLIVDSAITGNNYFFAADQNLIDTVTLFRLEGEESPRIESRINFDTEALELKVAHSCVAKALDHRGLAKNPRS